LRDAFTVGEFGLCISFERGVWGDAFTVGEFGLTPFPSLCISFERGVWGDAFTVGEFGLTPFPSLCISFERGVLRDELKKFRGWEILGSTSFSLSAFHLKEGFWGMN